MGAARDWVVMNSSLTTEPETSAPQIPQPVPPEPIVEEPVSSTVPGAFRDGDAMILEGGYMPPKDVCIKSGRPATRSRVVALRNPRNPITWFGRRPKLEVGLCRKHYENHSVAVALTWSLLGLGAVLLLVGIVTFSPLSGLLGLVLAGISGFFRAHSPITSPDASEDFATVYGVAENILNQLPPYED